MITQLVTLLAYLFCGALCANNAVTYTLNGGRFGDNLLSFISAAWFSHTHNVQLLLNPFDYSNQLKLDALLHYTPAMEKQFQHIVNYSKRFSFEKWQNNSDTLFVTSFYNRPKPNMKDIVFREKMRSLITPKQPLVLLDIPSDCVTVALHVRTGGGFSMDEKLYTKYPLRFVPLHFYADQLKTVLQEFPEKKLYVYIFTDDQHPERIIDYLETHVVSPLITYDKRTGKNHHNLNVLEDFFAMMQFQVLIRPVSNFSKMAEYLGNFDLIIVPASVKWLSKTEWIIDGVKIIRK